MYFIGSEVFSKLNLSLALSWRLNWILSSVAPSTPPAPEQGPWTMAIRLRLLASGLQLGKFLQGYLPQRFNVNRPNRKTRMRSHNHQLSLL
ncbi:hypothetical protein E4U43_007867 [Claviceps pusilla]|uniref:Uncharacterized protein n=1 Tax=Claviceps pusilla TaxID=123648 RepID=A0A9P7SYS0_9HYPO|nr:hypothetical protein E4U43_007867 [Claviceps pusilla]